MKMNEKHMQEECEQREVANLSEYTSEWEQRYRAAGIVIILIDVFK